MVGLFKFGKGHVGCCGKGVQDASVSSGGGARGVRGSYSDTEMTVTLTSMVGTGMRDMDRLRKHTERRNANFLRSWIRGLENRRVKGDSRASGLLERMEFSLQEDNEWGWRKKAQVQFGIPKWRC